MAMAACCANVSCRASWPPTRRITRILPAGSIRFWRLGQPHELVFDETYYAKDAWSLLRLGHEGTWPDRKVADPQVLADPQVIPLSDTGAFVAHPPTGKWVIAVGEWMFGLEPFGWRFMTALLGTLSVLMLCRVGRRLFRSTFLGCLAGALMAVDGLHFVMSRTALLDLEMDHALRVCAVDTAGVVLGGFAVEVLAVNEDAFAAAAFA